MNLACIWIIGAYLVFLYAMRKTRNEIRLEELPIPGAGAEGKNDMMREYHITYTIDVSAVIGCDFFDESPEAIEETLKELIEKDCIEPKDIHVRSIKFSPGEVLADLERARRARSKDEV